MQSNNIKLRVFPFVLMIGLLFFSSLASAVTENWYLNLDFGAAHTTYSGEIANAKDTADSEFGGNKTPVMIGIGIHFPVRSDLTVGVAFVEESEAHRANEPGIKTSDQAQSKIRSDIYGIAAYKFWGSEAFVGPLLNVLIGVVKQTVEYRDQGKYIELTPQSEYGGFGYEFAPGWGWLIGNDTRFLLLADIIGTQTGGGRILSCGIKGSFVF